MTTRTRLIVRLMILVALIATACGQDDSASVAGPGTATGPITTPSSGTEGGRGWLEGDDLDWYDSHESADGEYSVAAADAPLEEMSAEPVARDDADVATTTDGGTELEPIITDQSPLQAGSIDDGDDFAAYLAYRERILGAGVPVRPLDVDAPTVISVTGSNGLPVLDAAVTIGFSDQQGEASDLVTLRTTADGTTRFLPDAHSVATPGGSGGPWQIVVTVGDATATATAERGEPLVELAVDAPGGVDGSVPLDIHFLLDATGSMDDEIDRLRSNMATVAEQIDALPSEPDVRFGMTVYRDEGDVFVTRTFDLTDDLGAFLNALDDVVADGGGDYPEALDEALADALQLPEWRRDGAIELIVLIADAPPVVERSVETPYTASALAALEHGVKILPVAASGTDNQAEFVFRELAYVTGGRFVFLSYGVHGDAGTATGELTDIGPDDYDQLPLDQLVVRLVEDEIEALTGAA